MTTHTTTDIGIGAADMAPKPADLTLYYLVHRALRSGAERIATAVRRCAADGDRTRMEAISTWYRDYQEELHLHHDLEDERFFPALADRVPVMSEHEPRLHAEHVRILGAMERTDTALTQWTGSPDDPDVQVEAVAASAELSDLLAAHLAYEDADILPLFVRHFTADEYDVLEQAALKSAPFRAQFFTVPFIVEAAEPGGEREELVSGAPTALRVMLRLSGRRYARRTQAAFR